jgi:hypothetical protein
MGKRSATYLTNKHSLSQHRPLDLPSHIPFDGIWAHDVYVFRRNPLRALFTTCLLASYSYLGFLWVTTKEDKYLYYSCAVSLALIVGGLVKIVRLWTGFWRHQRLADEEMASEKRRDDETRKVKSRGGEKEYVRELDAKVEALVGDVKDVQSA